ncbi:LmeA family phospholipid-binding protein [Crocosphaera sp. Alani8]|uniref:LmeA family phospholipid-binding protein n=1 Tax=Crocosphaera sp. Alani8 TaxID=3038952 RepID=UPI00313D729F
MFFKLDDLGEKTINKIAEVALSTKLEKRDKLEVKVKTDPNLLAKGTLESLVIDCQGLMVENSLRMESINITLNTIAVSPLKALAGNIQLTQPSRGKACVLLREKDITRVLNREVLRRKQHEIVIDTQVVQVSLQQVKCNLLETGKILIEGEVKRKETKDIKPVSLEIQPKICQSGKGVTVDEIKYLEEPSLSSIILNPILEEAKNILNLKNFKVDGFSLRVEQFNIRHGALHLEAEAGMTHFPTN